MQTNLRKWGNSPSVRIPASVMAASGFKIDQRLEVRAEDGRVILEPVPDTDPAFAAALSPTLNEWTSPEDEAAWANL